MFIVKAHHVSELETLKHVEKKVYKLSDKKIYRVQTKSHCLLRSKKPQNSIQHPNTVQ